MESKSVKLAIVGSRNAPTVDIEAHIGFVPTAIISGGARGIDTQAAEYARSRGICLVELKPNYAAYGKGAPLRRNDIIVAECDMLLAFWDGKSKGTSYTINSAKRHGKPVKVVRI